MGRNKRTPSAAAGAAAVAVVPEADGEGVSPLPLSAEEANGGTELTAGKMVEEEGEVAKLKELNAELIREVMEKREQVAALTALVEKLAIATTTGEVDAVPPHAAPAVAQESLDPAEARDAAARLEAEAAIAVELEAGAQEAEAAAASKEVTDSEAAVAVEPEEKKSGAESVAEPEKKQLEKKKKKAPARRVKAHKAAAAEVEKISTAATATAPADQEEAGRAAPGGRPRRVRKANTLYHADTWAR